jgi:hypothetical protein
MDEKLREDETKYQNLRSEEVLFRLKEKLGELRKRAVALHDGIAQVDSDRAGADTLPRRLRPKVQQCADDAEAMKKDNEEIRAKVAEEGSPTFPWVLEKNGSDLGDIQQRLTSREKETGPFVQVLANDVVGRYDRLLQSFDEELKRRQQAKKDQQNGPPPPSPGGQQKNQLVPPVAELLLLRRLEEDVLQDVRNFRASNGDAGDSDLQDARVKLLERMGHRHSELTDVFDALVRQQTEPEPEGDKKPAEDDPGQKNPDEKKPDEGKKPDDGKGGDPGDKR